MRYPAPIYLSLINFVFPFDAFFLSKQRSKQDEASGHPPHRDYAFIALSLFRYCLTVGSVLVFVLSREHWHVGLALLLLSLGLYYVLYIYIAARHPTPTTLQTLFLAANLAISPVNFFFDTGGASQPVQHAIHFLLLLAAAAFGGLVYAVLTPIHKAYGCYPASTPWYDLDKGLCPEFFGNPNDKSRSPICRLEQYGQLCTELNPPRIVYRHVFSTLLGAVVFLYLLGLPAKVFKMVL